jgi:2-oxoglutarate dehydrogenase complex dihydrolipoamide succinyltransferase (E2) component
MAFDVVVPQMGESVHEGTIVEWKVNKGDKVEVNQPLVEVMTDKINVEIPAEVGGVLEEILVEPGTVVPVGKVIARISSDGAPGAKKKEAVAEAQQKTVDTAEGKKAESKEQEGSRKARVSGYKARMVPAVRKLIREYGLDASDIDGSGPDGRITKEDVERAAQQRSPVLAAKAPERPKSVPQPAATPSAAPHAEPKPAAGQMPKYVPPPVSADEKREERIPLAGPRKSIAAHMTHSKQTSPHVTTFEDCDFTELVKYRARVKDDFQASYGAKLTYMPFIMKAAAEALKEYPTVNASMTDEEIIIKKYYNIGIAVARDVGLIVPVVKNVDKKSIIDIAVEINDLGERARREKLTLDDVQGGTFTVTNAGMFGATASTPIISQPQVAILGVHMIQKKPVVHDDEIVIRDMMTFGLSFDHRLIDGHTAVQFLHQMIQYLERPTSLLLRLR